MKNNKTFFLPKEKLLICLFVLLFVGGAKAQTQALKQLELDIQKLAQLKAMLSNMYSGYSILANGYDNIKNQSLASFNLHKNFIDGLSLISPAVKNAPAVTAILSIQAQIAQEYKTIFSAIRSTGVFTAKELNELTAAYNKIMARSTENLDALQLVITPNKLQMSDPERLEILESLRADMEKQLLSLRTFTGQANQMNVLRKRLKKDNNMLRNQYGIAK